MRASRRFGVLSDQYIRENYADCFLPIRVDKLHSVRQKPANSFVNTSGKRVKEYNSIAPVIPQFIAENNSMNQNQLNAIKSDLIRTSANAKPDLNILQPPRKREGTLQEDIGFTKVSSMANAKDPKFGKIDKDFVSDELEEQAAYAAYGDKVEYNTLRGEMASRHKEDMSFAGKGAKSKLAQILDPNVSSQLFLASEFKNIPESPLFAKPDAKPAQPTGKQGPSNLFPGQQRAEGPGGPGGPPPSPPPSPPNEGMGAGGPFGDELPQPPPTRTRIPPPGPSSQEQQEMRQRTMQQSVMNIIHRGREEIMDKIEYKSAAVNRGEKNLELYKGSVANREQMLKFLKQELIIDGMTKTQKDKYFDKLSLVKLRQILQKFFPSR